MQLDHERLDVYELALEFLVLANGICRSSNGKRTIVDDLWSTSLPQMESTLL